MDCPESGVLYPPLPRESSILLKPKFMFSGKLSLDEIACLESQKLGISTPYIAWAFTYSFNICYQPTAKYYQVLERPGSFFVPMLPAPSCPWNHFY